MGHVLVTGASGFIGLAAVEELAARGDRITAMDLRIGQGLEQAASQAEVTTVACDITELPPLLETIQGNRPDVILHCAAVVGVPASVSAPLHTMRVNVEGSLNVMEAARLTGVPRVVHMSTEETYGAFQSSAIDEDHPQNPVMAYGISKLAVEHLGRSYGPQYGLEVVNLRTSWVYGPDLPSARVPKIFVDAALSGTPCHLPWGEDWAVDHTYIDDVVMGILLALDKDAHDHDVYNLGSGTAPTLAEIVDIVRDLVPGADISVGSREFEHGEPGNSFPAVRKGALIVERARASLGYAPRYDMRAGLQAYLDAARSAATG